VPTEREIIHDDRLLTLTPICPECGEPMTSLGFIHRSPGVSRWHVAFESQCRPDDEWGLWFPEFQPVIDEVLRDHGYE
jgi:hypothetical protein